MTFIVRFEVALFSIWAGMVVSFWVRLGCTGICKCAAVCVCLGSFQLGCAKLVLFPLVHFKLSDFFLEFSCDSVSILV